jgi:antitoxin HicB
MKPDPGSSSAPYKLYNIGNNKPVADLDYKPNTPVQLGIDNFVKWYRVFFGVEGLKMRYIYPVELTGDADGRFTATCKDVPEALTDGDSEQSALDDMSDALGAALAGYSLAGRALPVPSKTCTGEYLVPVNALVAAKLALRTAMQAQSITNVNLAERLGISESAVRRLVNPDHFSRLDGVVAALQILGRRLVIEDQVAA